VPGQPENRAAQRVTAGRDTNVAARDQIIITAGADGAGPVVPGMLPRNVPAFTGREAELARLAALAEGGAVVVSAIGGTAGVGKTALAVHAAHRLLPQFTDGHLYADLRGYTVGQAPAEPGEVLEVFLRRLGVAVEEIPVSVEERSGLLRGLLASRRVLMVLDNAGSEAQVRPLLPGAGESLVLVTSRSMLAGLEVDERISLDVLPEEEATELLASVIGASRVAAEAEAVARVREWCGRLPLALRIAGQILAAHPAWPVARLERMLADERDRLQRLAAGDLQVRAAFGVSYRQLPEPDAKVFRLLGLHPGPDLDAGSAAALAGISMEEADGVLGQLAEACLVTDDGTGRFTMHDLLRLFARQACQDTDGQDIRDAAETRLVDWYVGLAGFLDSCLDPRLRPAAEQDAEQSGERLPTPREALAAFQAQLPGMLAAVGLAARRGQGEQVWQLSESTGDTLTMLRQLNDLLTIREAALAAARHAGNVPAEGRAFNNLGYTYGLLRRFEEAIGCFEQSLEIHRESGNRFSEGVALNNLGNTYQDLRRFEEAIGCYEQSLEIRREVRDRPGEGRTLLNLGNTHQELRQFEEAIGCYEQSLEIGREIGDRYGEGQTLNNLGNTYQELRRFEEAIGCYEQSLEIRREIGDRYGEGETLLNLGNTYPELRQPDRAAACWQDAAVAMRDAGEDEEAARLEQMAADARPRKRRLWWK
jgi:tetratricopeptide (TPR) repeat protein